MYNHASHSARLRFRAVPLAVEIVVLLATFALPLPAGIAIRSDRWLNDAKYLSSDELKGRGDGTPELEKAAEYIASQFRQAGIQPVNGTYFQPFEATVGSELGSKNKLVLQAPSTRSYQVQQDYTPLSMSASREVSGEAVFVGYGITAPEYHYDDYAGVDAKGKIVIVLRHEPQEDDANSVFMGKRFTRHAALYSKARNAREHGASAMLLVNDPRHSEDHLIPFGEGGAEDVGLPVLQVKRDLIDEWMKRSGHSLSDLQKAIDHDLSNHSFALPPNTKIELRADVKYLRRTLKNVAGLLPGSDPKLRDQVIVVGAHYDHLGLGGPDSLAPEKIGQIHHGADDNASGTAGMIELARDFSAEGPKLRRSVLFLAFAGEELGLFGSADYVEHPLIPLDRTIAMINLDMIGRVKDNKLYVGGVGTSPDFRKIVEEEDKDLPAELRSGAGGGSRKAEAFQIDFSDSGYDASDHMSFARKNIPVIFFFSGLHPDYHKPSDTWDKLEPEETARVLQLVSLVLERIDATDQRPVYTPVKRDRRYHGDISGDEGNSESQAGGYGPYFGSIPDFGEQEKGVKFAGVQDNSPAAKAGLKAGDVLVQFDGKAIDNLYDFTDALRSKSPGDEVTVVVLRGGEKVQARVKLERRE